MRWEILKDERVDSTARLVDTPEEARQLAESHVRTWAGVGYIEGAGYYWFDWVMEKPPPRGVVIAVKNPFARNRHEDALGVTELGKDGEGWCVENWLSEDGDSLVYAPYRFEDGALVEVKV